MKEEMNKTGALSTRKKGRNASWVGHQQFLRQSANAQDNDDHLAGAHPRNVSHHYSQLQPNLIYTSWIEGNLLMHLSTWKSSHLSVPVKNFQKLEIIQSPNMDANSARLVASTWPSQCSWVPSALLRVVAKLPYSFYSTTGKESLIWIAPPSSLSPTQIPCLGGMTASPVLLLQIKYNKYGSKKPDRQKADLERQNKENTHIFTKANEDKRRQRNGLWAYWRAGKSDIFFFFKLLLRCKDLLLSSLPNSPLFSSFIIHLETGGRTKDFSSSRNILFFLASTPLS